MFYDPHVKTVSTIPLMTKTFFLYLCMTSQKQMVCISGTVGFGRVVLICSCTFLDPRGKTFSNDTSLDEIVFLYFSVCMTS